jgi:hypothetical protein
VEPPDEVLLEQARAVVRLLLDKLVRRVGLGRLTMWMLPVQVSRSGLSVGPRATMPSANRSM